MITPVDLEFFGKQAAQKYTEEGISLNDTITKLAEEHGLNKAQTDRVIETANTETYIALANRTNSPEKYITFEVASPQAIKLGSCSQTNDQQLADYKQPPQSAAIEKTAEIPVDKERLKALYISLVEETDRCIATNEILEKRAEELKTLWNREVAVLESHVKQAALSGTAFDYISAAMKTASARPTTDILIRKFKENLSAVEYTRYVDMSKVAAKRAIINTKHPIIISLLKLAKYEDELHTATEKIKDGQQQIKQASEVLRAGAKLLKEISVAGTEAVQRTAAAAKKHKTLATAGAAGAVAGLAGTQIGRSSAHKEVSALQLKHLPTSHNRTV